MNAPSKILSFTGLVRSVAGPGRDGITLLGLIAQADGTSTPAQLSLIAPQLQALPAHLNDVSFEALTAPQIVLRSGAREWRAPAATWQLHQDVGAAFYAAVPPRRAPWTRRLAWRVLLAAAGTAPGQWLLLRRSRAKH